MIAGLRTSGSRATDIIQTPNEEILNKWMEHRLKVRNMSMDEFGEVCFMPNHKILFNGEEYFPPYKKLRGEFVI